MQTKTITSALTLSVFAFQLFGCGAGSGSNQTSIGLVDNPSKSTTARLATAPTSASNFAQAVGLVKKLSTAKSSDMVCDPGAVLPSYASATDTITQDGNSFNATSLDDNFLTLYAENHGIGTITTQYYNKSLALLAVSDIEASAGAKGKCRLNPLAQAPTSDLKPQVAALFGAKYTLNCPTLSASIQADGLVTFGSPSAPLDSMQIAVRRVAASWLGESFNSKAYVRLSSDIGLTQVFKGELFVMRLQNRPPDPADTQAKSGGQLKRAAEVYDAQTAIGQKQKIARITVALHPPETKGAGEHPVKQGLAGLVAQGLRRTGG